MCAPQKLVDTCADTCANIAESSVSNIPANIKVLSMVRLLLQEGSLLSRLMP